MPRETVRGHADAAKTGGFQQSEKSIVFRVAKEGRPGRKVCRSLGLHLVEGGKQDAMHLVARRKIPPRECADAPATRDASALRHRSRRIGEVADAERTHDRVE